MMKNKRYLAMLLSVVMLALMLAGCAAKPAEEGDLLARIQSRGSITVAMEGTWAPWTYHNEADELVGYDVEIAQKIAEKLGCREGRVHTSLCRSRKKLRDYLIREELL